MKRTLSVFLFFSFVCTALHAAEPEQKQSRPRWLLEDILTLPVEGVRGVQGALENRIFNLGQIRVSGSRLEGAQGDAIATDLPHNISVIGAAGLAEERAEDLPAILSRQEGVTYTDELGDGLNARIDLRGFGGEAKQALVLLDGLRAVEPFDNSVAWHLYPTEFLRRVDIQRGAATIYGEGAFSGAIALKTKEPTERPYAAFESSFGDFQTQRDFVEGSGTAGTVGVYAGARYLTTDGYRQNGDHEGVTSLVKGRWEPSDAFSVVNTFYFGDHDTGIPGPLTPLEAEANRRQKDPEGQFGDHFDDRLLQNEWVVRGTLENLGIELSNSFGVRSRDQFSEQSFGGFFGGTSVSDIDTLTYSDVVQASWTRQGDSYSSTLTTGVEWSLDDIHNPSSFRSFSFGPFDSDRAIDRRLIGAFIQHRVKLWEKWIFEWGLRGDRVDWDIYDLLDPNLQKRKKADNLSPQAGVEYKIAEPLSVYATYGESFKVPDANTLIFETPNLFTPNPNIDPQIAHHHELGVRYAHPVFGAFRADVFYIETKKEILFNAISTLNENFDTRRSGFEIGNEVSPFPWLDVFTRYTYTDAEFDNGPFDGRAVPLVPENVWSAGFTARPDENWTFTSQAAGVADRFALNDFNNRFPVEDYWTLGARIAYHRGNWEVYVRGENVLGEEYSSFSTSNGTNTLNVNPAPTEYAEAGFRIQI